MDRARERGSVVVYIWSITSVVRTKMLSMIEGCVLAVMALLSQEMHACGDVDNTEAMR
jgi:hypothetical protein